MHCSNPKQALLLFYLLYSLHKEVTQWVSRWGRNPVGMLQTCVFECMHIIVFWEALNPSPLSTLVEKQQFSSSGFIRYKPAIFIMEVLVYCWNKWHFHSSTLGHTHSIIHDTYKLRSKSLVVCWFSKFQGLQNPSLVDTNVTCHLSSMARCPSLPRGC